jgi:uncharacterized protein YdaU (DUF1376 family)
MAEQDVYAPPASQFYWSDFISDGPVIAMSLEERGAYITMLCVAWMEEGLPDDHRQLAKLLRITPHKFASVWESMEARWYVEDGRLYNRKMERIREEMRERSTTASEAGKRGAKKRWGSK